MKKGLLIVNAVLVLAVIGLYILHFCCCGSKSCSTGNASFIVERGEAAPEGSIVYIHLDSLVNGYDMFHDLRADMEKKAKGAEEDLTKRGKSFEREYMDFQEKVQKGLVTRSQAEQLQNQLQQKQANLQQYIESKRAELAEEEGVMLRRIYNAVTSYLKEYNKERNYSLIVSTNGTTNVVLEGNPSLDITKEVLDGLNASYVRPK